MTLQFAIPLTPALSPGERENENEHGPGNDCRARAVLTIHPPHSTTPPLASLGGQHKHAADGQEAERAGLWDHDHRHRVRVAAAVHGAGRRIVVVDPIPIGADVEAGVVAITDKLTTVPRRQVADQRELRAKRESRVQPIRQSELRQSAEVQGAADVRHVTGLRRAIELVGVRAACHGQRPADADRADAVAGRERAAVDRHAAGHRTGSFERAAAHRHIASAGTRTGSVGDNQRSAVDFGPATVRNAGTGRPGQRELASIARVQHELDPRKISRCPGMLAALTTLPRGPS